MSVCQIKLIANVWLFSSSSIPRCRFVSEEAVCSIDLNVKNERVCVVSPFLSFWLFILSHIHYGNDILSAFSKQDSVSQVAEQKFSASLSM